MPYAFDRANKIIVYIGPDGSQRWYNPRDPNGSTLTMPENLKLLAQAWAAGDTNAETQIGQALATANQQEEAGAAATEGGGQVGVLPLPEDIEAAANVADTGFAAENRRRQIENRQARLAAQWNAAGLGPLPAAPGAAGGEGGFTAPNIPTTINGVALPANYVNAFTRVANVALGAEADRRERDLDALETQYGTRKLGKERWEERAKVGGTNLTELERELEEAEAAAAADPQQDKNLVSDQYGTYHRQNGALVRQIRDMKRTAADMDATYYPVEGDDPRAQEVRAQQAADRAGWSYGQGSTGWAENERRNQWGRQQAAIRGDLPLVPRLAGGGDFGSAAGFGSSLPSAPTGAASTYGEGEVADHRAERYARQNTYAEQRRLLTEQTQIMLDAIETEKAQTLAQLDADHQRTMAELKARLAPMQQRAARQRAGIDQDRTASENLIKLRPLTTRGPVTQWAG